MGEEEESDGDDSPGAHAGPAAADGAAGVAVADPDGNNRTAADGDGNVPRRNEGAPSED